MGRMLDRKARSQAPSVVPGGRATLTAYPSPRPSPISRAQPVPGEGGDAGREDARRRGAELLVDLKQFPARPRVVLRIPAAGLAADTIRNDLLVRLV